MLNIFIGYDDRQAVSYNVLQASIMARSSQPVAITPLVLPTLPMKRRGLTPFTFSRFICPYLCGFQGRSVFMDADMLVRGDVAELFSYDMGGTAVAVVPHAMKFEWSSMMLFDNEKCTKLTPEFIDDDAQNPLGFKWTDKVAGLPKEWNHLVGYDTPNPNAKLVHYTQGVPMWPETIGCEFSDEWRMAMVNLVQAQSWETILGGSVHAKPVLARLSETAAA